MQQADDSRLVGEHGRDTLVSAAGRGEHLDDDAPTKRARPLQLGEPHLAHATESEAIHQHVAAADAVALSELAHARSPGMPHLPTLTRPRTYLLYPPQRGKSR